MLSRLVVIAMLLLGVMLLATLLSGCEGSTGDPGKAGEPGEPGTSVGAISGRVADATGTAIEGATVATAPATAEATTDAQGMYEISDVAIGVYALEAEAEGYKLGYQGDVSVAAGKASTINLTLAVATPFPLAKVAGVGLRSVGVGSTVELEGKDEDAHGNAIAAWAWEVSGPRGVEVELDDATSQTLSFVAAEAGKYEVKIAVTLEDGTTESSTVTINAGTYVGVETCASCHSGSLMPDMVSAWNESGHATKFEDTFARYSEGADYCIACHTTGYNEDADNGGFDDLAKAAGWDSEAENIGAWVKKMGLDGVKASAAGKLINIQCEQCHGPGSVHTGEKSFAVGVCEVCHGQPEQWEVSGHAEGTNSGSDYVHAAESAGCAYCHTGQGYVVKTIRHQAIVFPDEATPERPATMFLPGDQPKITCATCHDPHALTYPETEDTKVFSKQLRAWGEVDTPAGVTIDAGVSATCVNCHANKRDAQYKADFLAGKKTRGVHDNPQADVVYGVNESAFTFGETLSSSAHATLIEEGCVECHMARTPGLDSHDPNYDPDQPGHNEIGEHTLAMAVEENGVRVENVGMWQDDVFLGGACNTEGCHASTPLAAFNRAAYADYDGDGAVEGIQDEVQGLLDLVAEYLPKDAEGNVYSYFEDVTTTEAERRALWNYWLVANDGSLGIHNTAYAVQLLQKTYEHLTGNDVPGATLR
ncbi:MAG: carboxypeptidase regulatory-like domain-containing protein [Dehalococcoidia bacterium]